MRQRRALSGQIAGVWTVAPESGFDQFEPQLSRLDRGIHGIDGMRGKRRSGGLVQQDRRIGQSALRVPDVHFHPLVLGADEKHLCIHAQGFDSRAEFILR